MGAQKPSDAGVTAPSLELPIAPAPPRAKRTGPRRGSLDAVAIVDAAIRVLDAEGLDAVTMRRVGQELGTGGASLYSHVADKETLLDLVFDRIVGELPLPAAPDPARWQEQVKAIVRGTRNVLVAHRDVARVSIARIPTGPNALQATETLLGVLRAGGLPDQICAFAVDLLPLYAVAVAYEESIRSGSDISEEDMLRYHEDLRMFFAKLPAERFPNMAALADPLTAASDEDEDRFEFGLDVIVRGLEARAAAKQSAKPKAKKKH